SIAASGGACSDPGGLAASDIDAAQGAGRIRMGQIVVGHLDFGPLGANDFADAAFAGYDFNSLLSAFSPGNFGAGIRGSFATPSLGTCTVTPGPPSRPDRAFDPPGDPTNPVQILNAGPQLNLNGPQGNVKIAAQGPFYGYEPDDPFVTPGDYIVDNGAGT